MWPDLLSGFLSKSKGQTLRIAACVHVLFHLATLDNISAEISESAVIAAINFTDVCCEHASLITGRGRITDEVQSADTGENLPNMVCTQTFAC